MNRAVRFDRARCGFDSYQGYCGAIGIMVNTLGCDPGDTSSILV